MKNPRHLFILVGIIAQALTWDNSILLAGVATVWCLAAGPLRGRVKATLATEALALVLGCVLSVTLNRWLGRSSHFFLGDGLVLLQLVRVTRELSKREKITSVVIAAFHFGVLCTLAPNIRFIALFIGAIFLFPGALKEVLSHSALRQRETLAAGIKLVPSFRVAFWLVLGSAFCFVTFPRFTGTPLQLRESLMEQGSLLDTILDSRRGGRANSQQVLLQIEGDQVGYLRCFALTETDGVTWRTDNKAPLLRLPYFADSVVTNNARFRHRRVFVKNSLFLGKIVPVDGKPVAIKRNFFDWPFENKINGALETASMWTTGNNVYDYWIDTQAEPQPLPGDVRRRLLYHPRQSAALTAWVDQITTVGTNALQKARLLEGHLLKNFTYKIGTPDLNRLAPVDDLIFNRKEGHCERFASAMALFLRMQGIPSRVVIGYVASTRNLFSNRLQVRFRDAHSWTEGYIEGLGWVTFDATPGPPPSGSGSDILDFIEALDFAWYSHIVNFNGFAQKELLTGSLNYLARGYWKQIAWVLLGIVTALVLTRVGALRSFSWPRRFTAARAESRARHYYDEMLHLFERRGLSKAPQQTPAEFLEQLREGSGYGYNDAAIVTEIFCRAFYGEKTLTPEEQFQARIAVARLKEASHETDYQPQRS